MSGNRTPAEPNSGIPVASLPATSRHLTGPLRRRSGGAVAQAERCGSQSPRIQSKSTLEQVNPIVKQSQASNMETCSICLDTMREPIWSLKCKHKFDFECIRRWAFESRSPLQPKPTCPVCREPICVSTITSPIRGLLVQAIYREQEALRREQESLRLQHATLRRERHQLAGNRRCGICLDPLYYERTTRMRCTHRFHARCLRNWQERGFNCPICDTNLGSPSLR